MSRSSSSLNFEVIHLKNDDLDIEDEVGVTCLGYFDDAELTGSAFDLTLEKLEQPIDFDFGDLNIQKLTKRDVLKTVDEISLAALANDIRNFINISVNGAICRTLLDPGATLSLACTGPCPPFCLLVTRDVHACASSDWE